MKRAFSLLELVFVVIILSLIITTFLPKITNTLSKTNISQIKSDISLIRSSIKKEFNNQNLHFRYNYLEFLDDTEINKKDLKLFTGIDDRKLLKIPFISSDLENKKIATWIKTDINEYRIYVDKTSYVDFLYDSVYGTFDCDYEKKFCKELTE